MSAQGEVKMAFPQRVIISLEVKVVIFSAMLGYLNHLVDLQADKLDRT